MGGHYRYIPSWSRSCYSFSQKLNPFLWSNHQIGIVIAIFFTILIPIYIFIGFQPNLPANAADLPQLSIDSINLNIPVEPLTLNNHQLDVPANIAGSYSQNQHKTLLVGHSSTAFRKLNQLQLGQSLEYKETTYIVTEVTTLPKSEVNMTQILSEKSQDTIILMTCAGENLPNQDATHRLIINAISLH